MDVTEEQREEARARPLKKLTRWKENWLRKLHGQLERKSDRVLVGKHRVTLELSKRNRCTTFEEWSQFRSKRRGGQL